MLIAAQASMLLLGLDLDSFPLDVVGDRASVDRGAAWRPGDRWRAPLVRAADARRTGALPRAGAPLVVGDTPWREVPPGRRERRVPRVRPPARHDRRYHRRHPATRRRGRPRTVGAGVHRRLRHACAPIDRRCCDRTPAPIPPSSSPWRPRCSSTVPTRCGHTNRTSTPNSRRSTARIRRRVSTAP